MSLQDEIRTALTQIATDVPGAVVAVVSGSETTTGIRGTGTHDADLGEYGEQGLSTNLVRVSAGDMSEPAKGAAITVDGNAVFVTSVRLDAPGALLIIEFQERNEVE